jgi:hypothetical protein
MVRKSTDERCGFAAAYREGLGLAAIAVVRSPAGTRIIAAAPGDEGSVAATEEPQAQWWCRRAADAMRVASAARRLLRRGSAKAETTPPAAVAAGAQAEDAASLSCARAAVLAAAEKFNVVLQSDQEIVSEAMNVAARIDAEMQTQQRCGGLKSVNKAYRSYRLESCGRGERVLRYDEWMRKYRENLVRLAAFALRQL